jgi:hypothetical protein
LKGTSSMQGRRGIPKDMLGLQRSISFDIHRSLSPSLFPNRPISLSHGGLLAPSIRTTAVNSHTISLSLPQYLSSSRLLTFDLCPIIVAMNAHFLSARTNPSPVPRASVFGSHSDRRQDCYPPIAGHFHSQSSFRECR